MLRHDHCASLSELRGSFRGKRLFAIGNGPSLRDTPLDLLVGEHSIAMNRIALIYPTTKWRPSFFVCTTTNIERSDWRRDILQTIELGVPTFAWQTLHQHIGDRHNVRYLHCTHGREVVDEAPDEWWSDDIETSVCKFGTSMLPALQIGAYLGFSKIYLLGCDLGFVDRPTPAGSLVARVATKFGSLFRADEDLNHFDQSYGTPGLGADLLNRNMLAAHNLADRVSSSRGFQIFNSTPGGGLDVYQGVDLNDLF